MRQIDADDLLTAFPLEDDEPTYTKSCVRMTIKHMPTIDTEPIRHERWISESQQRVFKCSVCGHYLDFDGVNAGRGSANFCPNCGAKMEPPERTTKRTKEPPKEPKEQLKEPNYKGCRNCKHQIEPLRGCEWLERGGDGKVHFICPRWERKEDETC